MSWTPRQDEPVEVRLTKDGVPAGRLNPTLRWCRAVVMHKLGEGRLPADWPRSPGGMYVVLVGDKDMLTVSVDELRPVSAVDRLGELVVEPS